MTEYLFNIEELTRSNSDYRRVIYTDEHVQVVLMCIQPEEDIPDEIHKHVTQTFHIVDGLCMAIINEHTIKAGEQGELIIIPSGTYHRIVNPSHQKELKFYTLYSPPNHPPGTVHKTRAIAIAAEEKEGY